MCRKYVLVIGEFLSIPGRRRRMVGSKKWAWAERTCARSLSWGMCTVVLNLFPVLYHPFQRVNNLFLSAGIYFAFSALILLVGQQEGHLAHKIYGGVWWRWALVSPDGAAPSRMVSVSASVNLPLHHKVRSSLLALAHPGGPGKRAIKRLWCGGGAGIYSRLSV